MLFIDLCCICFCAFSDTIFPILAVCAFSLNYLFINFVYLDIWSKKRMTKIPFRQNVVQKYVWVIQIIGFPNRLQNQRMKKENNPINWNLWRILCIWNVYLRYAMVITVDDCYFPKECVCLGWEFVCSFVC